MAETTSNPPRTWRPIALWSAAILLALGAAWFVGAVVVPHARTEAILEEGHFCSSCQGGIFHEPGPLIEKLGGPEKAVHRLRIYIEYWPSGSQEPAVSLLGDCGHRAVPVLVSLAQDESPVIRRSAVCALGRMGSSARGALPTLEGLTKDSNEHVRYFAAEALKQIRDEEPPK